MEPNPLASLTTDTPVELAAAVFLQKEQRRKSLTALPVEAKYQHFLQLQRMVATTLKAADGPVRKCGQSTATRTASRMLA